MLGWRPVDFWPSTPHEFFASLDAWRLANDPNAAKEEEEREFQEWARDVDPNFQ